MVSIANSAETVTIIRVTAFRIKGGHLACYLGYTERKVTTHPPIIPRKLGIVLRFQKIKPNQQKSMPISDGLNAESPLPPFDWSLKVSCPGLPIALVWVVPCSRYRTLAPLPSVSSLPSVLRKSGLVITASRNGVHPYIPTGATYPRTVIGLLGWYRTD